MSIPVLATKLYIPPSPPKVVARPRLIQRLNENLHRKLTLIAAPAGFGKTTLVSQWVAAIERPVAWLALDEADNDSIRFLTYLIASLKTVAPMVGTEALSALQMSPPPATESILTTLLNDIAALPNQLILVLDDYHLIDTRPIDLALAFLLEHLPPSLHLVITTREDPPLPLSRLRARSQLTELRAADLRFTTTEAAEFLSQVMGLNLSATDLATLEDRTEGWIAGLQLAALSMQGRHDVSSFIQALSGDHRYIVDYLVEEVLRRQPDPIRSFLLQTSILDELSGSLCNAVTGQEDSNARLQALERGNFFIVSLDDNRFSYRYHHLFAEVLRTHLTVEQPGLIPVLHRRASAWYEQNGRLAAAIHHTLAAGDLERAATLVELGIPALRRNRQETTMLAWLEALPDQLVRTRPVLSVQYAGALLSTGHLEGVEARLRDAEQWLSTVTEKPDQPGSSAAQMVVVDEEEFRGLPASIAIYRTAMALAVGNVDATMKYAEQVLHLVPEEDHIRRGAATGFLGLCYWTRGELETAHKWYSECMTHLQKAGFIPDAIGCTIALADMRITQGRLREAMSTYEQGLRLATEHGESVLRGIADMYVGLSALHRERNDLNGAREHLLKSNEFGDFMGLRQNPYRWRVAMARISIAQGDLDNALVLLDEAERLYVSDFFPNVRPLSAIKAQVWVAQGKLSEALSWAGDKGLSVEDELSYVREFEHITLTRILLAQFARDRSDHLIREAVQLLERLRRAAEEGNRTGSLIEILLLQTLAYRALGDTPASFKQLEQALMLAEPEGYVRIFLDEGQPMAALLDEAAKRKIAPAYIPRLLSAFGKVESKPPANQTLIEPLSDRELEVLRLLKTELSGPEIAGELSISLSTLRTHTKNIFSKLGVNNRRAAIRQAEELKL